MKMHPERGSLSDCLVLSSFFHPCKLRLMLLVLLSVRPLVFTVAFITLSETTSVVLVAQNIYQAFALAVRDPGKQFSLPKSTIVLPFTNSSSECLRQSSPVRKKSGLTVLPPKLHFLSNVSSLGTYSVPTPGHVTERTDGFHRRIYKLSNGRFKAVVPCVVLAVRVLSQPSGVLKN
jgi:hypothetical protein